MLEAATAEELYIVTGRERPTAQCRVLKDLGIPYIERHKAVKGMHPFVLRRNIIGKMEVQAKEVKPDFSAAFKQG